MSVWNMVSFIYSFYLCLPCSIYIHKENELGCWWFTVLIQSRKVDSLNGDVLKPPRGKLTGLCTELFLCLVFPQVCCLRIKVTSRPAEASVSGSPSAGCTRGVPSSSTICTAPPRARWPCPCTISPPTAGSHQLQLSALTDNFSLVSSCIINDRNQLLKY